MLRSSLIAAGSVILCAAATAQTQSMGVSAVQDMQGPAKYAGTFHVATGTWTRNVPTSVALGVADVIYNNTSNTGTFTTVGMETNVESIDMVSFARIPSTGSAGTANRDNYNINNVEFGYCIYDNTAVAADVLVTIYSSYSPCADPDTQVCSGEFLGTGLPGATAANIANGAPTCWIVNYDLTGGGEICILGDGDGFFDSDLAFDSFGMSLEFDPGGLGGYVGSTTAGIGPILAGDRAWTVQATGEITASLGAGVIGCAVAATGGGGDTYYGPVECCVPTIAGDNSTGLDVDDGMWFGAVALPNGPGCYFFGAGYANPLGCNADGAHSADPSTVTTAALYAKLEADLTNNCVPSTCVTGPTVVTFCDPASLNSGGVPAILAATFGTGVGSDLHLEVTQGVDSQIGYFLAGNEATAGVAVSNGLLCLVGTPTANLYRYNVAGGASNSIGIFDAAGVLQNIVSTSLSGSGFDVPATIPDSPPITITAGDTWHFQCWFRDTPAGVGTSNFSNGISVTF